MNTTGIQSTGMPQDALPDKYPEIYQQQQNDETNFKMHAHHCRKKWIMNSNCGKNDKSGTHVQVVPQQEEAETQSHQAPASTASPFEIETDEGNMSNENTTVGVTSTFPEYSTKLIMADKTCADEREKHIGTEQSHPSIITICISEGEKQLLQLLNSVTERYNEKIPNDASSSSLLLTVRIAGGWVRDKILGHPYDQNTNDIDIAINIISGVQFAELVQSYLLTLPEAAIILDESHDNSSSSSSPQQLNPNMHKMGVIAANPEQSKHLETACMKLFDIDIDFTNLRSHEVYSHPDNRIPDTTIQFGTPHSDAYRRDFTINALYYNVQTKMIEDYTTRGLRDLHHRYLQTPLDPQVTFADDPLRILRAIRFAIRFQLSMDDRIVAAAQDQSIQLALQNKVSRERVGKELEGMLSGKGANPIAALQTIHRLRLSSSIFSLPTPGMNCKSMSGTFRGIRYNLALENIESQSMMLNNWDDSIRLLSVLSGTWELLNTQEHGIDLKSKGMIQHSRVDQRLLPLAVYLFPFRHLTYIEIPKNNAATVKEWNVVTFIMKESIKFKNLDVQAMSTIFRNIDSMMELLQMYSNDVISSEETNGTDTRLKIGTMLCDAKELWVTLLLLAAVVLVGQNHEDVDESRPSLNAIPAMINNTDWLNRCHTIYHDILYKFELDNCWNTIRPIMNGQELIRALNLPKGPTVGWYMEEQMKYLIRYPTSTKQQCLQYLQGLEAIDVSVSLDSSKVANKKKKTKM